MSMMKKTMKYVITISFPLGLVGISPFFAISKPPLSISSMPNSLMTPYMGKIDAPNIYVSSN
jgi:hypothetical protein